MEKICQSYGRKLQVTATFQVGFATRSNLTSNYDVKSFWGKCGVRGRRKKKRILTLPSKLSIVGTSTGFKKMKKKRYAPHSPHVKQETTTTTTTTQYVAPSPNNTVFGLSSLLLKGLVTLTMFSALKPKLQALHSGSVLFVQAEG